MTKPPEEIAAYFRPRPARREVVAPEEHDELERLEAVIHSGLASFIEVGHALQRIRDGRLYRSSHDTFESYCRERWSFARNYANKLIASTSIVETLGTIVPKPVSEGQVRPLTALPPEKRAEAWERSVKTAPKGKVTAKHVKAVVDDIVESKKAQQSKPQSGFDFTVELFKLHNAIDRVFTLARPQDRAVLIGDLRVFLLNLEVVPRVGKQPASTVVINMQRGRGAEERSTVVINLDGQELWTGAVSLEGFLIEMRRAEADGTLTEIRMEPQATKRSKGKTK